MEADVLVAINGLRTPWLDAVLDPIGEWGLFAYPIALLLYAAWRRDRDAGRVARDGLLAFLSALFVAESVLKPLIGRPRPTALPALLERLHVLGAVPSARSLSMPSGTAAACFAAATWIALRLGPRYGVPALALALAASFARLYAGLHWPTDVLVGIALGVLLALAMHRVARALDGASGPGRSGRAQ